MTSGSPSSVSLQKQKRTRGNRAQVVYRKLKSDILALRLLAGDPLPEIDLAERYDASRTPVREALSRLRQEGLVVKNGRGFVVRKYTADEVQNISEIREALEGLATRLAIERASDEDIAALRRHLDDYPDVIAHHDEVAFLELDSRFHLSIARLSGNPDLAAEITRIREQVQVVRHPALQRIDGMGEIYAGHQRIVSGIERRDATVAAAEMRHLMKCVVKYYREAQEEEDGAP